MGNSCNYYRLLQVQPDAATEVIRASYRTLMQKLRLHPDLGGDVATAALINEAYRVLSSEMLRAAYDAERAQGDPRPSGRAPAHHGPPSGEVRGDRSDSAQFCAFCGTRYPGDDATTVRCFTCRSPLHMGVAWGGAPGLDVRRVPRLERRLPLRFLTRWPQPSPCHGMVEDLSVEGIRFSTGEHTPGDSVLRLECELLDAVARVVDTRPGADSGWAVRSAFVSVHFKRRNGGFVRTEA